LIVDFVGEPGPISKFKLILLDLVVLGLQLLMLVVGNERQRPAEHTRERAQSQTPDLEAAEEGRAGSRALVETEDGVEMQSLLPRSSDGDASRPIKAGKATRENDLIILDMKEGLTPLMRRDRASANPAASDTTADRAGLTDLLSRIAAARARAS
jgi:hypothetical protein